MIKVKDKDELRKIIEDKLIPLNEVDISEITEMSGLFIIIKEINGSISNWDVSKVINMEDMFALSELNEDISSWDVSNVEDMSKMFYKSIFNQDISRWNISSVRTMKDMFVNSKFNHNLGFWDLSNKNTDDMFSYSEYTLKQYEEDRSKYLSDKQQRDNLIAIYKSLNEIPICNQIEFEF